MIEYHLWITLVTEPDDEPVSSLVRDEVRDLASELNEAAQFKLSMINGLAMFHGCGAANHPLPDRDLLSHLCLRILEIAPLSYGLVYFLDDDVSDRFIVWVVRDGAIHKELDPFSLGR